MDLWNFLTKYVNEMNFPDFLFESLQISYGKYFDFTRWVYQTPEFDLKSKKNALNKFIVKDVLAEVFDLIWTIPSDERSFSIMKINLKNQQNQPN